MTDYVWYPVTGNGQTQATQFIWHTGSINWTTAGDWVQGSTLVFQDPSLAPGAVPGSGAGSSQGAGADNVGLVAGDVLSTILQLYQPNPSKGDPYIGSHVFSVDVLLNSGTVDIHNLLLSGFNQYSFTESPQLPVLDVEGATFKVEGSIASSALVIFPTITNVPFVGTAGGQLQSTGGGTIDIGSGGTVQIAGSVQSSVILKFNDGNGDLLNLGAVSASTPGAFAGSIANFATGDTIFLPSLPSPASYTPAFNSGTLTISNGATTLATLPISGSFTSSSFSLVGANGGTDVVLGSGTPPVKPVISVDTGITVQVGGAGAISSSVLTATDSSAAAAQLTYTVTTPPLLGTVLKNGVATSTFTQADINAGLISYQENGNAGTADTIGFSVTDPSNNSATGSLAVAVTPASSSGLLGGLSLPQQLELIYVAYFNRAADGGGLGFWGNQNSMAQTGGQSAAVALTNIANSFTPQPETTALYPFLSQNLVLSSPGGQAGLTAFITSLYNNLFGHAPDPIGQGYWVGQITNGAVGLGAAALAIANGATGADAIRVQNKIAVALDFTTRTLAAGMGKTSTLPVPFVTAARSVLSGVDSASLNDASVTAGFASTTAYLGVTPVVTGVAWNNTTQTVTITGTGFGSQAAYNGDSQFIEFFKPSTSFSVGYSGPDVHDTSTLNVISWTNNQIQVQGFTGTYGTGNFLFNPGDSVNVSVANPGQTAPLFDTFPSLFTLTVPASSAQGGSLSDPAVITIAGAGQVIDPGAGDHTIQFLSGSSADTLVLHAGGVDQVSGFDPAKDVLDVRSLLGAASADMGWSQYLSVTDTGTDAVLNFDPTGHGGGSAVAVLQGLAGTGLDALMKQAALRIA